MRWIIGDIHGMLRPLSALVEEVLRRDRDAQLLFSGDYVNRGADSRGVIEFLINLPNARFVRGNHDDIFDQVLHGQCFAENATREDRIMAFQWFMRYGLDATFISYGADIAYLDHLADHPTIEKLDALVQWIPPTHRHFIRTLPPTIDFDDIFIVHGKWDPIVPVDSPSLTSRLENDVELRHSLLWGRYNEDEILSSKAWNREGFFGHTPVTNYGLREERAMNAATSDSARDTEQRIDADNHWNLLPIAGNRMTLLDTAAALGFNGRLTAFCVETRQYVQTTHFGELLPAGV